MAAGNGAEEVRLDCKMMHASARCMRGMCAWPLTLGPHSTWHDIHISIGWIMMSPRTSGCVGGGG